MNAISKNLEPNSTANSKSGFGDLNDPSNIRRLMEMYRAGELRLSAQEIDTLLWRLRALDAQTPPEGDWRVWLFLGGRGAGKTRGGAEWVRREVVEGRARRVALVGPTLGDVREVMIEGPSGLRAITPAYERPSYEPSRRRLCWPNGAEAFAFSAEDPDSLRGPQFDAAWCDEVGAWAHDVDTWDTLMFALRLGEAPRVVATTTPRARALVKRLVKEHGLGRAEMTRAGTQANAENLAAGFVSSLEEAYAGTRLARQELMGELVEDPPGAMWSREVIEGGRVRLSEIGRPPPSGREDAASRLPLCSTGGGQVFERVVVAVDPPASSGAKADACGIVAAGLRNGVVYVLADASCRGLRPLAWAERAVAAAREWGAGEIVAEANQGGEMVRQVLEMAGAGAREGLRVRLLYARESKTDRARPVSAAYEQGRVKHAGVFRELEDEMCSFGAEGVHASPDRVDALVWAVKALRDKPAVGPRILNLWSDPLGGSE